jgi:hypothetical protein
MLEVQTLLYQLMDYAHRRYKIEQFIQLCPLRNYQELQGSTRTREVAPRAQG